MIRSAFVFVLAVVASTVVHAQSDAVQRGQKVYAAEKCSVCHSIGGIGNKKGPLDEAGTKLSADQIRSWIVNAPEMAAKANAARKPPMKAYTSLAKEDLDGLVAYLSTLKK